MIAALGLLLIGIGFRWACRDVSLFGPTCRRCGTSDERLFPDGVCWRCSRHARARAMGITAEWRKG
jgi:hypothetical protein